MCLKDKRGFLEAVAGFWAGHGGGGGRRKCPGVEVTGQTESEASSGAFYRESRISTIVRLRVLHGWMGLRLDRTTTGRDYVRKPTRGRILKTPQPATVATMSPRAPGTSCP